MFIICTSEFQESFYFNNWNKLNPNIWGSTSHNLFCNKLLKLLGLLKRMPSILMNKLELALLEFD